MRLHVAYIVGTSEVLRPEVRGQVLVSLGAPHHVFQQFRYADQTADLGLADFYCLSLLVGPGSPCVYTSGVLHIPAADVTLASSSTSGSNTILYSSRTSLTLSLSLSLSTCSFELLLPTAHLHLPVCWRLWLSHTLGT